MKTRTFTFRFANPAFLGNAEQNGAWRTPPIKALLRQWWRVAYAAQGNFQVDVGQMRREEAMLFGHAWLEDDYDEKGNKIAARRSKVRLRLDKWSEGTLKREQWQALQKVEHPEVKDRNTGRPKPVGSDLYLGYGPLEFAGGSAQLKKNAAIQAGESAVLRLAYPEKHETLPEGHGALLEQALWLMDRFGALGGRSRNGWGSFSLQSDTPLTGTLPLRGWTECLDRDWPHAMGKDGSGALIWQTTPQADWKKVMVELAKLKIGLRTSFKFPNETPPHHDALSRHWLSYPITKHGTRAFPKDARLPNSLRFKVRPAENGQLVGVVFHVPCLPPAAFRPDRATIETVWQRVHRFLDDPQNNLSRIQE